MSTDIDANPRGYSRVAIFDPTNKRITYLDPVDGGVLPVVDLEDSMVNRGMFFTATIKEDKLKPPKRKYIYFKSTSRHMETHISKKSNVATTKPVSINFYESPTISVNNLPIEPKNSDRSSTRKSIMEIYEDPTVSDVGTLYFPVRVDSEKNPVSTIILKKQTGYLIEIIPERKNTSIIVSLAWFEADR